MQNSVEELAAVRLLRAVLFADESPGLTDEQLRDRLTALATRFPAGPMSGSQTPEMVPGERACQGKRTPTTHE